LEVLRATRSPLDAAELGRLIGALREAAVRLAPPRRGRPELRLVPMDAKAIMPFAQEGAATEYR
jgi:hypothetical protein